MTVTTRYNASCTVAKWNGMTLLLEYGLTRTYMHSAYQGMLTGGINNCLGTKNCTLMPFCPSWLAQDKARLKCGSHQQPLTVIMQLTCDTHYIYLCICSSLFLFLSFTLICHHNYTYRTSHLSFCTNVHVLGL